MATCYFQNAVWYESLVQHNVHTLKYVPFLINKKQTNKQKPKILVMYNSALCLLDFIIYMASAHFTEVKKLTFVAKEI